MRGLLWLEDLRQDVRYAIRTLWHSPGFAAVAIVTLAVGIGATTAIYSVVDTILLRPLPFAGSDRLVRIHENVLLRAGRPPFKREVTYRDFLEWRARTRTLVGSGRHRLGRAANGAHSRWEHARLWAAMATADVFSALGIRALYGRTLSASDEADPDVAVLGFDAARRLFGGAAAVGTTFEVQPPETMFAGAAVALARRDGRRRSARRRGYAGRSRRTSTRRSSAIRDARRA